MKDVHLWLKAYATLSELRFQNSICLHLPAERPFFPKERSPRKWSMRSVVHEPRLLIRRRIDSQPRKHHDKWTAKEQTMEVPRRALCPRAGQPKRARMAVALLHRAARRRRALLPRKRVNKRPGTTQRAAAATTEALSGSLWGLARFPLVLRSRCSLREQPPAPRATLYLRQHGGKEMARERMKRHRRREKAAHCEARCNERRRKKRI